MTAETSDEWLIRVARERMEDVDAPISTYIKNRSLGFDRPGVLVEVSEKSKFVGMVSFFIEKDIRGLKRSFYVVGKLLQKSHSEGWGAFANYAPFLYGLLSESPEIYEWLAHAELKEKDEVKTPHFLFHQFQLVLRHDDEALRESIALVAKKGGKHDKVLSQAGQDFFSLLLSQEKEGLQALIENQAKIKSANELEGQFLAGFAVVHAKLCWYRGIEVQIQNPLVPMELLPIEPLDFYDVEYDFLRQGWMPPPPPGLFSKIKRLLLK